MTDCGWLNGNVPTGSKYLDMWSQVLCAIWGGSWNFRRNGHDGGTTSVGIGFEII